VIRSVAARTLSLEHCALPADLAVTEGASTGNDEALLLDEPDNYLDVPGKLWLEEQLRTTPKTVLLISHACELLS